MVYLQGFSIAVSDNITGEKYIDYLNRIRMEKAAEKLLDYSNLKVKDIAEMVGFENPYYYMKRFKQHFECTPSEYRKFKIPEEKPYE